MPDCPDRAALLRLMAWLSPAFPVGAFAYSHGLEAAIVAGLVSDRASLTDWIENLVQHGSGWNDAVLLAAAWRTRDDDDLHGIAELGTALAGSRERHLETTLQGKAFADAMIVWDGGAPVLNEEAPSVATLPYPVAVGAAAARHGLPLEATIAAFLHAFASNLVSAAVRLVPLGQRDGVTTLARLSPTILATAADAARSSLDDLGSAMFMSEIMSLRHETQYSRVFRS